MSPRNKAILISAVCGGVIGALATRFRLHGALRIPALTPDHALLEHLPFFVLAGVGWVLFSLYWEIAAKNAAGSKGAESRPSRAVHVALANLALLFAIRIRKHLGRNWSREITIKVEHELIRSGPYNPCGTPSTRAFWQCTHGNRQRRVARRRRLRAGSVRLLAQDSPRRIKSERSVWSRIRGVSK
jgi:hypothetical protein